jgi:hypothetical protein
VPDWPGQLHHSASPGATSYDETDAQLVPGIPFGPHVVDLELEQHSGGAALAEDLRRARAVTAMSIRLRLRDTTWAQMHAELSRPHAHAAERVGFLTCGVAASADGGVLLVDSQWQSVDDTHYLVNPNVGACIGPAAFRAILQFAYHHRVSILHVHRHEHYGRPGFSTIDLTSLRQFVPDFWNVRPEFPHGALVLSHDSATGLIWMPEGDGPIAIDRIDKVGMPLRRWELA